MAASCAALTQLPGPAASMDGVVSLADTGARFAAEKGAAVFLDQAAECILVAHKAKVLIYGLGPSTAPPQEVHIEEGPAVAAAGLSPDKRMLVVQRSPLHLQCLLLPSAKLFLQGSQQRGGRILGFMWVPAPRATPPPTAATLIVVTQAGLELWTLGPDAQVLVFREGRGHPCLWHLYSHEMRLVLLGSGAPASIWLQGCQFTAEGMVRLPPFQIPEAVLQGEGPPADAPELPTLPLNRGDLHLLNMGQQMYCAHVNRHRRVLSLYHFYKDAVMLQHQLDLASAAVHLSVVDNFLVAHYPSLSRCAVFDPSIGVQKALIPPQPMRLGDAAVTKEDEHPPVSHMGQEQFQQLLFFGPAYVVDRQEGAVWTCNLSLRQLVAACPDSLALVASLLQRRAAAYPDMDLRAAVLHASQRCLHGAGSPEQARPLLDVLHAAWARAGPQPSRPAAGRVSRSSPDPARRPPPLRPPPLAPHCSAISPEDIVKELLEPWSRRAGLDPVHVAAMAGEAAASHTAAGLPPSPALACFLVTSLVRSGCTPQAAGVVRTQPELASQQLAACLAGLGGSRELEGGEGLAADMLGRLGLHEQQARLLLQAGLPMRALAVVRQQRLTALDPTPFLQAISCSGDTAQLAAASASCRSLAQHPPSLEPFLQISATSLQ